MKLNVAIIFIASLTSGACASGNLRSRQNPGVVEKEDEAQRQIKAAGHTKENPDGSRLVDGRHEIMTSEQHQENIQPGTVENQRKMESYIWSGAPTKEEPDSPEDTERTLSTLPPFVPGGSTPITIGRSVPPITPEGLRDTGYTELEVTLETSGYPTGSVSDGFNYIRVWDDCRPFVLWETYATLPNQVYTGKICLLNSCCSFLRVHEFWKGSGKLTIEYDSKVVHNGSSQYFGMFGSSCPPQR